LSGFLLFICFSGEPAKRQRKQKPGLESPTGYQKPLKCNEWFFAFYLLFRGTSKTTAQAEAGVRIPYVKSVSTQMQRVVFCRQPDAFTQTTTL
jgi:hypothetical protein